MANWLADIRRQHQERRLRFALASGIAVVVYILMIVVTLLAWSRFVGGRVRPGPLLFLIEFFSSAICGLLVAYGPKPAPGRTPPEQAAADAFFAGKDVRSDDGKFDPDLN